MGSVVNLCGSPIDLSGDLGREIVVDFARYAEGLLDEIVLRKKYRFDDDTWEKLGKDDALVEAIEKEKVRRVRDGSSAREKAQQLFVTAPGVLSSILHDDGASPRHRIESARELRAIAANGPETTPASDRFQITINLGSEVLHFDKSIQPNPGDTDPFNDTDTAPQGLLAAIATKKRGGSDGQPL